MDDNTRDVVIAIATIIGGFLTAVVVARIVSRQDRGLEMLRWRREIYAELLRRSGNRTRLGQPRELIQSPRERAQDLERISDLYVELTLLRPSMTRVSGDLFDAALDVRDDLAGHELDEAETALTDARIAFRTAAAHDLGTAPGWQERLRDWREQRKLAMPDEGPTDDGPKNDPVI